MALTDLQKMREAVYVQCDIPEFADEEFLLIPYVRETAQNVVDDARVREWKQGATEATTTYDPSLFDAAWVKAVWRGCRGIMDPATGKRGDGPGFIHPDGRIIYLSVPEHFTEDNKMLLLNARPLSFYLWLQGAASRLAAANQATVIKQRETFRREDPVSSEISGPEL